MTLSLLVIKTSSNSFFSTPSSGLSALEQISWILYGGGQKLWKELYDRFNLVAFPCGNAGLQMFSDGLKRNKFIR